MKRVITGEFDVDMTAGTLVTKVHLIPLQEWAEGEHQVAAKYSTADGREFKVVFQSSRRDQPTVEEARVVLDADMILVIPEWDINPSATVPFGIPQRMTGAMDPRGDELLRPMYGLLKRSLALIDEASEYGESLNAQDPAEVALLLDFHGLLSDLAGATSAVLTKLEGTGMKLRSHLRNTLPDTTPIPEEP